MSALCGWVNKVVLGLTEQCTGLRPLPILPTLQQSLRCENVGVAALVSDSSALQAWWSELITEGLAPPGRFAHAAAGAGDTMYMVGGYAQGQLQLHEHQSLLSFLPQSVTADTQI